MPRRVVLWATKAQEAPQARYTFDYETILEENNGKQMKSVWRFSAAKKDEKVYGKHPTQKPVALIDRASEPAPSPATSCVDPFAGSGVRREWRRWDWTGGS